MDIRPLTPDLWPAFDALFQAERVTRTCWCMWWRVPAKTFNGMKFDDMKTAFRTRVDEPVAPGLVALNNGQAVGWVKITPRAEVPRLNTSRTGKPADPTEPGVWALGCFVVAKGHRRQGMMGKLASAACAHARDHGARAVEASAHDPGEKLMWSDGFTGLVPALERVGFQAVERRSPKRVLMRWEP